LVQGATLSGPGIFTATSTLAILPTEAGALNTYLSTRLEIKGTATLASTGVTVVFRTGGELIISPAANLIVSAPANFNFDTAGAHVRLEGTITVTSILSANVDIVGKGLISVPSGIFHHGARNLTGPSLTIAGAVIFESSTVALSGVIGSGSLNSSTNSAIRSSLGPVHISHLNVYGGLLSASSLEVTNSLSVSFGDLNLLDSGVVTGSFTFSGGSVSGTNNSTHLTAQSVLLTTSNSKTINSIVITAKTVTYDCPPQSVIPVNGGQIIVG